MLKCSINSLNTTYMYTYMYYDCDNGKHVFYDVRLVNGIVFTCIQIQKMSFTS